MPARGSAVYLDSSAIVKLVVDEPESEAVRAYLRSYTRQISSILALVEVFRAAHVYGSIAVRQAEAILSTLSFLSLTDDIARQAGTLEPGTLRSLDAIHVASALALGQALGVLVTYDTRLEDAARQAGTLVVSPAS